MLTRIKKAFQEAVYPSKCLGCGDLFHFTGTRPPLNPDRNYFRHAPIEMIFQKEMSPFICQKCLTQFTPMTPPFCLQCGRMFKSSEIENHLCGDCILKDKHYQSARSAGVFGGVFMETIHKFKYGGKIQLAGPLGRVLFTAYLNYFDNDQIDLVMPIPLHASKLKQRGFNQAVLILREWQAIAGEHQKIIAIDFSDSILDRKKRTESQTGLDREKRKSNVKGAFTVKDTMPIKGKQILLIDDVYTTGATAQECAKMLLKSGAGDIHVLTLARAV